MRFDGFYGNAPLKERLSGLFDSGRAPHALMLEGPAGLGKKKLAGILAAAFFCQSDGEKPCGVCGPCRQAFSGNHPDIRTVSGGGGPRSFSVDAVRAVRTDAFVVPAQGPYKVYLLTDVQTMSEAAQNALLKILEEPPAYVRFVLTCVSRELMLETVLSRCTVLTVSPASPEEAAEALMKLDHAPRGQAEQAARLTEGNIGRARAALKDGGLDKAARLLSELAQVLAGRSDFAVAQALSQPERDKELYAPVLELLPLLFRDALALRTAPAGEGQTALLSGCPEAARTLARSVSLPRLFRMQQAAARAAAAADRFANHTLLLTWLASELSRAREPTGSR